MGTKITNPCTLHAARYIADQAVYRGLVKDIPPARPTCNHVGVVLADSILQAGLNYTTVVKPRIQSIFYRYPKETTVTALQAIIEETGVEKFLQWKHHEKLTRFENLVSMIAKHEIESTIDLHDTLKHKSFRNELLRIKGIGPKTIDYMACLVGVDCIAVDRHIRGFAELAGLEDNNYDYLRDAFSYAADLLGLHRREFDASIWRFQSSKQNKQSALDF